MKVRDAMARDVHRVHANHSVREAAALMARHGLDCLPIEENGRIVGLLTDRQLTRRAMTGLDTQTRVREIMSRERCWCYEDQGVAEVARELMDIGLRCLPVGDRNHRLVGMIELHALGDLDQVIEMQPPDVNTAEARLASNC